MKRHRSVGVWIWALAVLLGLGLGWMPGCGDPVVPKEQDGRIDGGKKADASGVEPGSEPAAREAGKETTPERRVGPEPAAPEPRPEPRPTEPRVGPEPQPMEPTGPELAPDAPKTGADYSKAGPMQVKEIAGQSVTIPSSAGCKTLCRIQVYVSLPTGSALQAPYPLAIFSNGFQLTADKYKSYSARLASWGYATLRWDTVGENPLNSIEHQALGQMIVELIKWADAESKKSGGDLSGQVKIDKVYVVGHSRGGKASALAAQAEPKIAGIFGIDPVDAAPIPGPGNPSAVAGMAKTQAPIAVVGGDQGGKGLQPCAPAAHNYAKFYDAAKTAAWEILLANVGHMQFLDSQAGCLACLLCAKGTTADATVRSLTQTAMIAWAEKTIRGVDISAYLTGSWSQQAGVKVRTK